MKKNSALHALIVLTAVIAVMTSVFPTALAEEEYYLTMDMELKDNLLLADYGVTVYLDSQNLGYLPQGGRLIKVVTVPAGIHTFYFYPDRQKASVLSLDLIVSDHIQIDSTLRTHRKYIKINNLDISYSNGNSRSFRDLTDDAWQKYLADMFTQLTIYSMIYGE